MKRLFWDIEVSPNVCLIWRIGHKIAINHEAIVSERKTICIGYKWQHEKDAKCLVWDKSQDDKRLLQDFLKVAAEADELVAHNGDSYDAPWLRARCLYHGINPVPLKTIDTLQWARRHFLFNSNKLDYIAQFLGFGNKLHTEFGLWKSICLNKDGAALDKMVDYCKRDVILLQKVWEKLQLVAPVKTHNSVLMGAENRWACPRCCSEDVQSRGRVVTGGGTIQHRMQCRKCGGWYQISGANYKQYVSDNK